MPLSLVLALTPTKPFQRSGFYGEQARGWFLDEIRRQYGLLATALHAGDGRRPFTVSSLWCDRGIVAPGDVCYIRITSLIDPLTTILSGPFLEHLPEKIRIRDVVLQPLGRAFWHKWDQHHSFPQLVDIASASGPASTTILHFASPTSFHTNDGNTDLPLPTSDVVWSSLLESWQVYAPPLQQETVARWWPPLPINELIENRLLPHRFRNKDSKSGINYLWRRFAHQCIVVSDFKLSREKVAFKKSSYGFKSFSTGSSGYVVYSLLPAKRCGKFAPLRPGAERLLHLLACFALYSGVGHYTTQGMGQTRAVPNAKEANGRVMTPRYRNVQMG